MFRLIFKLIGFVFKAACAILKWSLILAVVIMAVTTITNKHNVTPQPNENPSTNYTVVRVVDGDTFIAEHDGVEVKVRMIGIDTPESVHADDSKNTKEGKTASEFTQNLLTGRAVQLEFDVSEADEYGRTLAYVYLDGVMVQETLLSHGYARVMTIAPNVKYADRFVEIQKEAREQEAGFWATDVWS